MSTSTTTDQIAKNARRKSRRQQIIIAGGGTGGHVFPAIAIANAIRAVDRSARIMFVGAIGKMEMDKVPEAGFQIKGLTISGYNRTSIFKNIFLPFKLVKSFFEVKKIFQKFNPTLVIGVGGYSTYPVLKFAQSKKIPTYIHESNSFAGKSNVLLGKNATKIFVASDGMEKFFPKGKLQITGNPVRSFIANTKVSKEESLAFFGLKEDKKTVLIVGGSLGARSINNAIYDLIDKIEQAGLQIIWQTGKTNADKYRRVVKGRRFIWIGEFINHMEMAYAAADIVISRAGAMSVTELCVVGKPSIFVPYPLAAEDHQTANAMALVNKKAALIVADNEVNKKLVDTVIALAKDDLLLNELKKNISLLAVTDADMVIAREILSHNS